MGFVTQYELVMLEREGAVRPLPEFCEGYWAFRDGKKRRNPYRRGSMSNAVWSNGWEAAEREPAKARSAQ